MLISLFSCVKKGTHIREGNMIDNQKAVVLNMGVLRCDKREGILGDGFDGFWRAYDILCK